MIFEEVKSALSMTQVAQAYGFEPSRAGFIRCPFHQDKTPSLKLYGETFHCFGCGAHGSVIDFASMLFGPDPLDAVRRLNNDFGLSLELDKPPNREDLEKRRRTQQARQHFEQWREQTLALICKAIRKANCADYNSLTEGEAVAVRCREWLEYLAEVLEHGNLDNRIAVFRERRGVERLCREILSSTPTKSRAG